MCIDKGGLNMYYIRPSTFYCYAQCSLVWWQVVKRIVDLEIKMQHQSMKSLTDVLTRIGRLRLLCWGPHLCRNLLLYLQLQDYLIRFYCANAFSPLKSYYLYLVFPTISFFRYLILFSTTGTFTTSTALGFFLIILSHYVNVV